MAYEPRDGSGSMFPNNRKEKDTHADWQGSFMIDGKEYWISAWNKQGNKGPWVSLSVKDKAATAQRITNDAGFGKPAQSYGQASGSFDRDTGEVIDDDLPF